MEKVLGYSGSLCLPVQPDSSRAVVDMVSAEYDIDGCMHFNPADFCTGQILLIINMMNMVILNQGKYASQMPYDSCLAAVVNIAPSDNMMADVFLCPSFSLCLADAFPLCLRTVLIFPVQPFIIIALLLIFAQ